MCLDPNVCYCISCCDRFSLFLCFEPCAMAAIIANPNTYTTLLSRKMAKKCQVFYSCFIREPVADKLKPRKHFL